MTWLAWRQQRFPLVAAAVLVCCYAALGVASRFDTEYVTITQLFAGYLTIGVCMFWGAPLVARDLERGTHRLAWTQSQTRQRWLTARLAVAAAGALATAALVTAIVAWVAPAPPTPMVWFAYESHGVVPYTRVLFGLALGVGLGALTRNTHVAMALSAPILGLVQLGGVRALRESVGLGYWPLQLWESAGYLGVAAILIAITYLVVRNAGSG